MPRHRFIQTGFVVPDLEQAIQKWRAMTDIGPFFIMRNVRPENGFYRGQPADLDMNIAFAQAGPMQVELIQPVSPAPSVYHDTYPAGDAGGPHHLCAFVDDLAAEEAHLRSQGVATAYTASSGDLRFGYYDTRAQLGCFTELMSRDPAIVGLFQMFADAAVDWDGSDPVRVVS